jgi:divalent metal cation (Fe/Co/Zn/Cd) transporter
LVPLVVLALAAVFESYGLRTGWKAFQEIRGDRPLVPALREVKQPEVLAVLAEDTAALVGIVVAAAGIALAAVSDNGAWDAAGSIGVGVVLAVSSLLLARETRGLLIGESADPEARRRIAAVLDSVPEVERTIELLTLQTAPEEVLVATELLFRDEMSTDEIEDSIDRIEERIRQAVPEATRIFIEPEDRRASRAGRRAGPSRARARRPPLRSSR